MLRLTTMIMAVFCFLLTLVLALSITLYDYWFDTGTKFWFCLAYALWGTGYFLGVAILALFYDILDQPQKKLRLAFWLALVPTCFYFYVLCYMAFA